MQINSLVEQNILREYIKKEIIDNPFILIEKGLLTIKTLEGESKPLILNETQKRILKVIKDLWIENKKPIRLFIYKARRQGVSTLAEAILYCLTSQAENRDSMIIADRDVNYLFEMSKYYHEKLIEGEFGFLVSDLRRNNIKRLEFEGIHSNIFVDTSDNKDIGRKYRLQYVHCSETAFWHNAYPIFDGLLQAVPNKPRTIVIVESTSNGVGNYFYEQWLRISKQKTDWIPIFFSWFSFEDYKMPLYENETLELSPEDRKYKILYNLSDEQMKWRKWCINNNCSGDKKVFQKEYPATPDDGFVSSGYPVFDMDMLAKMRQRAAEFSTMKYFVEDYEDTFRFVPDEYGDIMIWSMPNPNYDYVACCDIAEGRRASDKDEGGDWSVCNVICVQTGEQVLNYRARIDPDLFAKKCYKICKLYNDALIIPEKNSIGNSFINTLMNQLFYGNIFKLDDDTIGFRTDSKTKPEAISYLKILIRDGYLILNCLDTIYELMSFVNNDGSLEAKEGCYDDEVATLWMFAYARKMGSIGHLESTSRNVIESPLYYEFLQRNWKPNKTRSVNKITGY